MVFISVETTDRQEWTNEYVHHDGYIWTSCAKYVHPPEHGNLTPFVYPVQIAYQNGYKLTA